MRECARPLQGEERPDTQGHKESTRKQTREPPVAVRTLAFLTRSSLILPPLPTFLFSFSSLTFVEHLLCSSPDVPERYKGGIRHDKIFDFEGSSSSS